MKHWTAGKVQIWQKPSLVPRLFPWGESGNEVKRNVYTLTYEPVNVDINSEPVI